MNRVLTAARLQTVHPLLIIGLPWLIVFSSFALNWAIWGLADVAQESDSFTGGVSALYITVLIIFVQAVTQLLPFAMGTTLSRRTYWLGVATFAVAASLAYGVVLALLALVEQGTDGWGVGLEFWAPGPLHAGNFFLQVLYSGVPMLAFSFVGVGIGVVYKHWGTGGVWGLILGGVLVSGGLAVLITWQQWWGSIGSWFADQSITTLVVGLPAALTVVVAALSFAGIRRVVP